MVTRIAINDAFLGTMWINRWPVDPEIVKPFPDVLLKRKLPGCINPNAGRGCISTFICIKWNIFVFNPHPVMSPDLHGPPGGPRKPGTMIFKCVEFLIQLKNKNSSY